MPQLGAGGPGVQVWRDYLAPLGKELTLFKPPTSRDDAVNQKENKDWKEEANTAFSITNWNSVQGQ